MMVDAAWKVFNSTDSWENAVLPEGKAPVLISSWEVPDLIELVTRLLQKTIPEDIILLKDHSGTGNFCCLFQKVTYVHIWQVMGLEKFAKLYKTIYQCSPELLFAISHDLAVYLNIHNCWSRWFKYLKIRLCDHQRWCHDSSQRSAKVRDRRVRFIKIFKQTVKDQEMMALGTVQEIYDFLMERVDHRKELKTSSFLKTNLHFENHQKWYNGRKRFANSNSAF